MPLQVHEISIEQTASPGTSVTFCVLSLLAPQFETERYARNLDGALYERDIQNDAPQKAVVEYYPTSMTQTNHNILWDWFYNKDEVTLTDGAATTPEDPDVDAYFITYTGRILEIDGGTVSPSKSHAAPWRLVLGVSSITRLTI